MVQNIPAGSPANAKIPVDADVLAYVRATARLLGLPLDDARAQAVAVQLGRTALMAQQLDAHPLPMLEEISEIFCPAPFPTSPERRA
jgi:hypothetical protein